MSKLINMYKKLKEQDSETLYLFKSGIFYIFLAEDAQKMSKLFSLKLTPLNKDVLKCGFPCSSINKYIDLSKLHNLNIKIIELESNTSYHINEYSQNQHIIHLLNYISSVNVDNLSISEAYKFIEDLKIKVNNINN